MTSVVFMGTPQFAAPILEGLVTNGRSEERRVGKEC